MCARFLWMFFYYDFYAHVCLFNWDLSCLRKFACACDVGVVITFLHFGCNFSSLSKHESFFHCGNMCIMEKNISSRVEHVENMMLPFGSSNSL